MAQATSDDGFVRIEAKLNQILKLMALQITAGMKQGQAIQLLDASGFDRTLISQLLDTTPNTVSVTLAKAKAKKKAQPREIPVVDPATLTTE